MDPNIAAEIALNTNLDDIPNLCQTDKNFEKVCSELSFWQSKYSQLGATLITPQPTISTYLDDLKNCLNILPLIDPILSRLAIEEEINDHEREKIVLMFQLIDLKFIDVPSVDKKTVQRFLNYNKQRWLREQNSEEFIQRILSVDLENPSERLIDWSLEASIGYNIKTQRYQLLLSTLDFYLLFDVTDNIRSLIYLLIYSGVAISLTVDIPFEEHECYELFQ